jgi:hypothetical protein
MRSAIRIACVGLLAVSLAATSAPAASKPSESDGVQRAAEAAGATSLQGWRLSRNGFGRLKVGLTRGKIERRLGRSLRFAYNTGSCAIWSIRGVQGLSLMTTRGRLARVYIGSGPWRTSLGIRLGDSESKVRSRYRRLRTRPHEYEPGGQYLIVRGPNRRVVFETDAGDRVTGIRGGRVPEVMYIEGCA